MEVDTGEQRGAIAAMNIVPLIDILLVLLIILLVISPVKPVGLSAQIPQPATVATPRPPPASRIVVRVMGERNVLVNQDVVSWREFGSRLAAIFDQRARKIAFLQGADAVEFASVARAIDIMRASGVDKVGLMTGDVAPAR
jgi:biopolymer transport protein TolR